MAFCIKHFFLQNFIIYEILQNYLKLLCFIQHLYILPGFISKSLNMMSTMKFGDITYHTNMSRLVSDEYFEELKLPYKNTDDQDIQFEMFCINGSNDDE